MNPFAPPAENHLPDTGAGEESSFYLRDNVLIVKKDADLPNVCIWSGEAAGAERVHKTLYWAPTWTIVFVFSPVLYLLVYFVFRKRGAIGYSLGPAARERRRQGLLYGGGTLAVTLVAMVLGISQNLPGLLLFGVFGFLGAVIFVLVWVRTVWVVRIEPETVHLKLRPAAVEAFARLTRAR